MNKKNYIAAEEVFSLIASSVITNLLQGVPS